MTSLRECLTDLIGGCDSRNVLKHMFKIQSVSLIYICNSSDPPNEIEEIVGEFF